MAEPRAQGKGTAAGVLIRSVVAQRSWRVRYHSWLRDDEIYKAFSKRLPTWVYLYLAPGTVSLGPEKGFLQAPVIHNRGKPMYFVARTYS